MRGVEFAAGAVTPLLHTPANYHIDRFIFYHDMIHYCMFVQSGCGHYKMTK